MSNLSANLKNDTFNEEGDDDDAFYQKSMEFILEVVLLVSVGILVLVQTLKKN